MGKVNKADRNEKQLKKSNYEANEAKGLIQCLSKECKINELKEII